MLTVEERNELAERVRYVGSQKHKYGACPWLGAGHPGPNPRTVEQARANPPPEPFTMICPEKWNRRDPSREATELLRDAIRAGQFEAFSGGGAPKHVYARDPEDPTIIYDAHLMVGQDLPYKAYPLTDVQAAALRVRVR